MKDRLEPPSSLFDGIWLELRTVLFACSPLFALFVVPAALGAAVFGILKIGNGYDKISLFLAESRSTIIELLPVAPVVAFAAIVSSGNRIKKTAVVLFLCATCSCTDFIPKPEGYMRFDLPEKKYRTFDSLSPCRFDIPTYATMIPQDSAGYLYNLYFPVHSATLYLTYFPIDNNLDGLLEDAHGFVYKHVFKADAIDEQFVETANVAGLLVEIGGNSAAPLQFFVTDSVRHFLRGSLYFYATPNRDSLLPLIKFFKTDIERLMETTEFKQQSLTTNQLKK